VRRRLIGLAFAGGLIALAGGAILFQRQNGTDQPVGPVVERRDAAGPEARTVVVRAKDFKFHPAEVVVEPGSTVIWVHDDLPLGHNVHLERDPEQNPLKTDLVGNLIAPGDQVIVTFHKEGRYSYWCDPHPFMNGVVEVRRAGG
jgi:plastocyanin